MNSEIFTNISEKELDWKHNFVNYGAYHNVECITLAPHPDSPSIRLSKFISYCLKHSILFYLVQEKAGQVHYHGLLAFPFAKERKLFQVYFNRNYGRFFQSTKADLGGWYWYCHKDIQVIHRDGSSLFLKKGQEESDYPDFTTKHVIPAHCASLEKNVVEPVGLNNRLQSELFIKFSE